MQIAVLECEQISESIEPRAGDYTRLFSEFLSLASDTPVIDLVPISVHKGAFPPSVHDYDGYLITGSYAGVYDDYPWITELMAFVRRAYEAGIPMAGICFGHQVLAHTLGGRAEKSSVGWELGVKETRLNGSGRLPWLDSEHAVNLTYVHQDQITEIPPGAFVFASTDICPVAGFCLGDTVLGIQGHPEFSRPVTETMIRTQPEKFPPALAAQALESLADLDANGDDPDRRSAARWIRRFFSSAYGPEIERLAESLRFRTVQTGVPSSRVVFETFEQFLRRSFPELHQVCSVERIGDPGMLYTWPENTKREDTPVRDPLLFLAHYDVVPADPEGWRYAPFSGKIAEGFVWGRGALDDKGPLMSLMEALNRLAREGFSPRRTILIALGGDEETGGGYGAARLTRELHRRGISAEAAFDEGSIVAEGMLPFVAYPLALIGTGEKGYLDARVTAEQMGGHAAMPGRTTTLGRVAAAVSEITIRAFSPRMSGSTAGFLRRVGRHVPGIKGILLRHPRFFAPLLYRALSAMPTGDALVRTTVAPTMARGAAAPNVLPTRSEITLNLRLLPGMTRDQALERMRALAARWDVQVEELPGGSDPAPESPTDTAVYAALESVTREHFPDALVTPFLVTVTTDSKHYQSVARATYRFVPLPLTTEQLETIHGVNERISLRDYRRAVSWYTTLIRTLVE